MMPIRLALAAVLLVAACNPFDSSFVRVCEEALKATLAAPSTYRRVAVAEESAPIQLNRYASQGIDSATFDDFYRQRGKEETIEDFYRTRGKTPTRFVAMIEYEASNLFGVPLRLSAECTYETTADDASAARALTVRIDGKTKTERLIDSIRRSDP